MLLQRGVRRIVVVAVLVLAVVTVGSSAAAAATPPNTTIYNYDVYADNADFWFSSDTAKVSFQCRLDGNVFKPCVSPVNYRGLAEGTHTFEVRAVDSTGVVDATPANLTFTSTLAPPPPPAPAPDNDNWYGAQALTGTAGSVKGTTAGATTQWDEPFNPNGARHTVWYTWTAGRTANVTFTAAGDGFTPQVSVFSGSETSNAFMISTGAGSATVKTYAGLDYRISVDGVGDGTGPFALSWAFEQVGPANDYRAEAETLTGDSGSLTASNVGATVEVNEPRHDGTAGENADGHSIWYRWTAQSSGTAIFTTEGSSFDTSLRAYTESLYGGLVGQGWYLADLNPWTTWSRLQLEVKPGETYLIAVDGANGATGDVQLRWRTAVDTGDMEPPAVNMWSPEPNATVNGTVTFMSDASDNEGVDRVVYQIAPNGTGETVFVGESLAPPYDVTLDTSALEPGLYSVFATAYDASGNGSSGGYTITVGAPPPVLTVPRLVAVEATAPTGAAATWTTSATDYYGVALGVTCSRKAGSVFPLGTTKVTCSTDDSYGNHVSKSFPVHVLDTTAPTVKVPAAVAVAAVAPTGASVSYTAAASDVVSGALTPQCSPVSGATFAIGDTTVTCTATDAAGNTGSASFVVHVKGADEQLAELRAAVDALALDATLAARLDAQIDDTRKQLAVNRTSAACGNLAEVLAVFQKESGKRLTVQQSNKLAGDTTRIRAVVAC